MSDNYCTYCYKKYASRTSLYNHNKRFHQSIMSDKCKENVKNCDKKCKENVKKLFCLSCNKKFACRQSKYEHIKNNTCKNNNKIELLENKILELENKINDNNKINKTINNTTNNNKTTNNNNNGTINNITINQFGKEDIQSLLVKDIKELIKNDNYLVDIIKLLNFNKKLKENHNFCNTSLEGKYVSVFNADTKSIDKINKNNFYDKVLCNAFEKMDNLCLLLELDEDIKNNIKQKYRDHLDKKFSHINKTFYTNKVYKKSYKTDINQLSYNKNKIVLDTWNNNDVSNIENDNDTNSSFTDSYDSNSSDSD